MGHGITNKDMMHATGDNYRSWHGLGKKLPEGMSAEDGFRQIGLDWPTELAPVFAEVKDPATGEVRRVELPEHRAHLRLDDFSALGVVTDGYKQVTNKELAQLLDSLAGQDAASTLESAGSFYGGRRVFGTIKLPNVIKVGADIVETYVVASNGHGGFAGTNVYPTSMRPICANTLRWSERDLGKGITFRHTGDIESKMQQARVALGLAVEETKRFEEQVIALANTDLSVGQMADFLALTYDATFGELPDPAADPDAFEQLRAKREEILAKWTANLDDARQQVAGIQGTAWQGLNAITQWHDHERGRFKDGSDARMHSNVFGASNRDKQKALRTALSLVK